jgi:hypothetical protein
MHYKDTKQPQYEIPVLHHRTSGGTKRKGENNRIYLTLIMDSTEKEEFYHSIQLTYKTLYHIYV